MQRSPVIFWLLLAATAAVDVVAFSQAFLRQSGTAWIIVFDALVAGQLSVVSVWASLRRNKTFWTRVAPVVAVLAAAAVVGWFGTPPFVDLLPYYGFQVAALLAILWVMERTSFWQRRTGHTSTWQYSVWELLMLTTVVALLAAILRETQWFSGEGWINLAFISGSVSLAVLSTVGWTMPWHWVLRTSASVAVAMLLGIAFMLSMEPFLPLFLTVHYLIQAIVLSVWFGLGNVIPRGESAAAAQREDSPPVGVCDS